MRRLLIGRRHHNSEAERQPSATAWMADMSRASQRSGAFVTRLSSARRRPWPRIAVPSLRRPTVAAWSAVSAADPEVDLSRGVDPGRRVPRTDGSGGRLGRQARPSRGRGGRTHLPAFAPRVHSRARAPATSPDRGSDRCRSVAASEPATRHAVRVGRACSRSSPAWPGGGPPG